MLDFFKTVFGLIGDFFTNLDTYIRFVVNALPKLLTLFRAEYLGYTISVVVSVMIAVGFAALILGRIK